MPSFPPAGQAIRVCKDPSGSPSDSLNASGAGPCEELPNLTHPLPWPHMVERSAAVHASTAMSAGVPAHPRVPASSIRAPIFVAGVPLVCA